jgi:hypothetical protein
MSLGKAGSKRERIVQFHPSYGIEDLIEGLRTLWMMMAK